MRKNTNRRAVSSDGHRARMRQTLAGIRSLSTKEASRTTRRFLFFGVVLISLSGCGSTAEEARSLSQEANLACTESAKLANEVQQQVVIISQGDVDRELQVKEAKINILRQDWRGLDKTALKVGVTNQKITDANIILLDKNVELQTSIKECKGK